MMPIGQYDVGKYIKSLLEEVDYLEAGQEVKIIMILLRC